MLALGQLTVPERGVVSSRDQVYNFTPHDISSERLKVQTSNFVRDLATRRTNIQMTNCPLRGRSQSHVAYSDCRHGA